MEHFQIDHAKSKDGVEASLMKKVCGFLILRGSGKLGLFWFRAVLFIFQVWAGVALVPEEI